MNPLSNGILIIDEVLQSLNMQDTITIHPWIGINEYGGPLYGHSVSMLAIIEEKERVKRLDTGQEVRQKALITIPRTIAPHGAAQRREPIDPRDKIILPSGYTGPILEVMGVVDPETHVPYSFDVALG
jgi:hypothetical protein